jgi:hypothetical protein
VPDFKSKANRERWEADWAEGFREGLQESLQKVVDGIKARYAK